MSYRNWVNYDSAHKHWMWHCWCGEWDYADTWHDAHALLADHHEMGYHINAPTHQEAR